jgi:anti-anti-sigma factor
LEFHVRPEATPSGPLVVHVTGEVDLTTSQHLHGHLQASLEDHGEGPVVCDLSAVTFLDATGLHALIAAQGRAEYAGRRFAVAGARGQVRRTLELVRLVDMLECHDTVEAALGALRADGDGAVGSAI